MTTSVGEPVIAVQTPGPAVSTPLAPRLLRTVAIVIAIAGAIDPAVTSARRARPEVALVAGSTATDTALLRRVRDALDDDFTLIDGPFAAAAGTVLVGDRLPMSSAGLAAPVMAVIPARDGPTVTIDDVRAPSRAPLEARTPIVVTTRATGARGARLEVSLQRGELVVDRVSRTIERADEVDQSTLTWVPTSADAVPLRVIARIDGTPATASADLLVDVRERRWAVLFFDPRPSWQSTFVRRAIERDPRFVVTSRVTTSRNIGTEAGRPPATLDDFAAVSLFDAVIVGAPDALAERDVVGLDAYLRRRGGSVVLLLDQRTAGAYQRLAGIHTLDGATRGTGYAVIPEDPDADSTRLRASEIAWPRELPPGASVVAWSRPFGADSGTYHPVVWRSAIGAGQLIVSGALDAWRYRDPAVSAFDAFWRTTVATAADAAMPPVAISLEDATLMPGERTGFTVTLRDASLTTVAANRTVVATVAASLETANSSVAVRLWPDGPVGSFRGSLRAPREPGTYRLVVTGDGSRADVPLVVASSISRATPADDSALVGAWVHSRRGTTVSSDHLEALPPALENVLTVATRRETWYPMRSPWWIIPFGLTLGAEWLWRRRRGEA